MAHEHIVYMMLVDSAAMNRDPNSLKRFTPILEELTNRDNHLPYLAVAHRARGILHRLEGEFELAEESFKESIKLFDGLGMRWQLGRTLAEMAELELTKENIDSAKEYFKGASSAYKEINARTDLNKIQDQLKEMNVLS
jgi:tetratricopeptide (TPR) repeat protein